MNTQHPNNVTNSTTANRALHPKARRRLGVLAAAALGVAGVSAALTAGLVNVRASTPPQAAAPQGVPVQVAPVLKQAVAGWQAFSGRLEAVERVELRPRVAGTVQAVHFREGSLVRAGERLLSLNPAPYAADVARAEAQVAAAEARVAHTTSELARAQRLWDERAIAQRELDERANAAREAQARLRAEQAGLQVARLSLSYTEVVAPVAGRIGKLEVTPGNLVAAGAGAPVLATLVSVHPIYAGFDADEKLVARALASLPEGAAARGAVERIPVEMELAGGGVVRGRLQLVDNQVDARSGTVRVRATFDNRDGRLMPGQFAQLRLGQAQAEEALLVSERAIGTDQDKRFVIVAAADNTAQWREVTLGAHVPGAGGALRIVTSGLKGDERIVVSGVQRVRPGALLALTAVGMDAKPEQQAAKPGAARS